MYTLGIDIGSTTVKVAVLDKDNKILFSDYKRHFANIKETLKDLVQEAKDALGENEVNPCITGSGGLALAQLIGVPFTQEVVCVSEALQDPQKEIVVIQKSFDWNLEKLRDFLHVLRGVKVLSIFFIMNISTSVYTGVVSYVSLPQAFLVSKPAELVRCFSDFGEVRELQIELFCILKLVRQYHRKLKNL